MKPNTHSEEERLLTFAKRHLSEAFPNPKRVGCPDESKLRSMAVVPREADPALGEHLAFCSPCFNRYMDLLTELRQEQQAQSRSLWKEVFAWPKTSPMWIGSAVMVIGLISMVAYFVALQREGPNVPAPFPPVTAPGPIAFTPITLDLRELSPTRGSESRKEASQRRMHIPGSQLNLTLILPLGSEPEPYRLTLRSGDQALWSQSAQGHLHDGQMLIWTEADFRQVPLGSYNLEVESPSGIRLTQPVFIGTGSPANKEPR